MEVPQVRSSLVNLIITGKKNMERMEKLKKTDKRRLPVTLTVMRLLKATLREASMENQEKLLTWAACCLAFNGAFRIHELLSKEEGRFDPVFTLLEEDLRISEEPGWGMNPGANKGCPSSWDLEGARGGERGKE
jgi:hypothetical protein